jgi:hypothetical protein
MFSFFKKKSSEGKEERLSGPKTLPAVVGQCIVVKLGGDPDRVWSLKAVLKPNVKSKNAFDVRVFDDSPLLSSKVKDYNSLNEHPELILYEGWFDKKTLEAEIKTKQTGT